MLRDILVEIASVSLIAFIATLFMVQALAREGGYWLGRRSAAEGKVAVEGVGLIVGGLLGLLAFVLALTLSHASGRFQERRMDTLAESNAIGTAWLRAQAIGHPLGPAIARQIADYTRQRIDFVTSGNDPARLAAINARTNVLQNAIWQDMTTIARDRQDPIVAQLMASLNDMFDSSTAQRFAFAVLLPTQILYLIIGLTVLSMGALGFQLGLRGTPLRVLSWLLIGVWSLIVTLILDLGAPRIGDIRTSVAVYEWTLSGFGPAAPPVPR